MVGREDQVVGRAGATRIPPKKYRKRENESEGSKNYLLTVPGVPRKPPEM